MILSPVERPLRITQHFGERPEVYGRFGLKGHNGVDFTGEFPGKKVPVYAPYDALVWQVAKDAGYGNFVRLLTDKGGDGLLREVVLAHLDSVSVKQGDRVYLGDQVGIMGTTGFSDGVHLHLGLRRRNIDLSVVNYNNGYKGYVDFEPYLLFWDKTKDGISYPYDK